MSNSLIGGAAPPFELTAVSPDNRAGECRTLSAYAGRWLLLLFYPRDFSFVCPTELTAFSAQIDDFRVRGCAVLGVSVDSVADHLRWLDSPPAEGGIGPLRFPLAADPDGAASRAYGVWLEASRCSARGLFLIDPAGVLQYAVMHNTSVGRSTAETLRVLDALQSGGLCPASWTAADGTIDVEQQLRPGRVLGSFRIVEALGAGSFGSVFSADDLALDRRVALKIIGRNASDARDSVLAEARAAARLQHPNICGIHTVEMLDAVPVIVMEYIDGRPLSECDPAELDGGTRKRLALGIASGLAAAHVHGVVHGDLKPANIMVTRSGEAKLLDFGLARRVDLSDAGERVARPDVAPEDGHTSDTVIGDVSSPDAPEARVGLHGTPAFMSPEQTVGQPATFASDVYAFGLVLVQLLTGRSPIDSDSLPEVLRQIHNGDARRAAVASAPGPFRELLAAVLANQPAERPTMSEVIGVLGELDFPAAS